MKKIILALLILLCACGSTDQSKDGDTKTDSNSTAECTVSVDGNFIINNNTGDIFLDFGACQEADSKKEVEDCSACADEYEKCVSTGGQLEGTSDEECLVEYEDCLSDSACE